MQGNTAAAEEFSERLMGLNAQYETFLGGLEGTIFRNWALLQERHDPALMDVMQASLDELDRANHRVMLPFFMTCAAELKARHGDAAGALHLVERAAELVAMTGERWHEPELLRVKASLMDGDAEARTALLGQAIGLARRQGARLWELRAAMSLAQIHAGRHEAGIARQALEPVCASFEEGVDFPELRWGREFLASLDPG
jgi:predicted ATPase